MFRRKCWKHEIKINSATDTLIIIYRKLSWKWTGQILLIVVLMVGLGLKPQMEIVDQNDSTFTCLPSLHIFVSILRTIMHQSAEARTGPSQASDINLFERIVKVIKLTLLTIFVKSSSMDVSRALVPPLTCSNLCSYFFPIHEYIKQFWHYQICELYQNRLVFRIVFGIHCNSFIAWKKITTF